MVISDTIRAVTLRQLKRLVKIRDSLWLKMKQTLIPSENCPHNSLRLLGLCSYSFFVYIIFFSFFLALPHFSHC